MMILKERSLEKKQRWKKVIPKIRMKDQPRTKNLIQKNMVWWCVHAVTAKDTFKIQNVNVVQSAGALGY